jgi:hypothetical protein
MNKLIGQTVSICSRRPGVISAAPVAFDGKARRPYHRTLDLTYQVGEEGTIVINIF